MIVRLPELCPCPSSAEDPPGAQHLAYSLREAQRSMLGTPCGNFSPSSALELLALPAPRLLRLFCVCQEDLPRTHMEKEFLWVAGEMAPIRSFPGMYRPLGACAKSTFWWLHPCQAHGLEPLGGSVLAASHLPVV